jgi:hypothetical protein
VDPVVAEELWSVANHRRAQEYTRLLRLQSDSDIAEWEAQRQLVAAWARAANYLYEQANSSLEEVHEYATR